MVGRGGSGCNETAGGCGCQSPVASRPAASDREGEGRGRRGRELCTVTGLDLPTIHLSAPCRNRQLERENREKGESEPKREWIIEREREREKERKPKRDRIVERDRGKRARGRDRIGIGEEEVR